MNGNETECRGPGDNSRKYPTWKKKTNYKFIKILDMGNSKEQTVQCETVNSTMSE